MSITFVAAVNDREVLRKNLASSPCFSEPNCHELLTQEGFKSASKAYNAALQRCKNELVVFVHQDVYFPATWLSQLQSALEYLDKQDPDWGVLGCWGTTRNREYRGHIFSTGLGVLGECSQYPQEVQTLDEIVLIIRKSSGLKFDDLLPYYHLYGTDLCLRAAERRLRCYAISAFCIHNTSQLLELPSEFYDCYSYLRRVWRNRLPIQTPCIRITKFNGEVYRRKFTQICLQRLRRKCAKPAPRLESPLPLLSELLPTAVLRNDDI